MGAVLPGLYKALAYQQTTLTGSVQTLSPPAGAKYVLIQATAPVYWRWDGVAPTVGEGMVINAGQEPQGFPGNLSTLQLIGPSGQTMNLHYFG